MSKSMKKFNDILNSYINAPKEDQSEEELKKMEEEQDEELKKDGEQQPIPGQETIVDILEDFEDQEEEESNPPLPQTSSTEPIQEEEPIQTKKGGRKKVMTKGFFVRLPSSLYDEMVSYSEEMVSSAELVRVALIEYIKNHPKQ